MGPESRWRRIGLIVLVWAAVVGWATVIFFLSSQPGDSDPGSGRLRFGPEKVGHFVVFGTLGIAVANALTTSGLRHHRFWWTFVLCAIYAVTDELHQAFVPFRTPTVLDLVIDIAGATTGYLAYTWFSLIRVPVPRTADDGPRPPRRPSGPDVRAKGPSR